MTKLEKKLEIITQVVGCKGHLNAILGNSVPIGELSSIISVSHIQELMLHKYFKNELEK